jgi:hypothetical protein
MAIKKPIALYGGRLKELQTGDTISGAGGGGLSLVTIDPVSPANGDSWILEQTGMTMGALAMTQTQHTLKLKTSDGIRTLKFN